MITHTGVRCHLNGVRPIGVTFHTGAFNVRDNSLGRFALLSDELVLRVLEELSAGDLIRLSCASKAFYCFSNHEDLWKALVIEALQGKFVFQASWKDTYIYMKIDHSGKVSASEPASVDSGARSPLKSPTHGTEDRYPHPIRREKRLQVRNLFSDILYQGHLCATYPISANWLERDNLPRRESLTAAQFQQQFELPGIPVVMNAGQSFDRACSKWTAEYLLQQLQGQSVIAGDMEMLAEDYFCYMSRQQDDGPLYLFDKDFAGHAAPLAADYAVPPAFQEDLFALLGDARPDFRWLIVGPSRSGSTFHVDPNATSAWNACVRGRKLWVFFPPGEPPPGIHVSDDGASVAAPLCVMEWFISFFDACCELEESDSDSAADGPPDGVCEVKREARQGGGAGGRSCPGPKGDSVAVAHPDAAPDGPEGSASRKRPRMQDTTCINAEATHGRTLHPAAACDSWPLPAYPTAAPPVASDNVQSGARAETAAAEGGTRDGYACEDHAGGSARPPQRRKWYHGVVGPGEVVFVPQGWWHSVLNLDDFCVAVTQNFVSSVNLHAVLAVLATRSADLISGCPVAERAGLYGRFAAALAAARPQEWAEWEGAQRRRQEAQGQQHALAGLFREVRAAGGGCDVAADAGACTLVAEEVGRGGMAGGGRGGGSGDGADRRDDGEAPGGSGFTFGFSIGGRPAAAD